jgi:hypothetical protein
VKYIFTALAIVIAGSIAASAAYDLAYGEARAKITRDEWEAMDAFVRDSVRDAKAIALRSEQNSQHALGIVQRLEKQLEKSKGQ